MLGQSCYELMLEFSLCNLMFDLSFSKQTIRVEVVISGPEAAPHVLFQWSARGEKSQPNQTAANLWLHRAQINLFNVQKALTQAECFSHLNNRTHKTFKH